MFAAVPAVPVAPSVVEPKYGFRHNPYAASMADLLPNCKRVNSAQLQALGAEALGSAVYWDSVAQSLSVTNTANCFMGGKPYRLSEARALGTLHAALPGVRASVPRVHGRVDRGGAHMWVHPDDLPALTDMTNACVFVKSVMGAADVRDPNAVELYVAQDAAGVRQVLALCGMSRRWKPTADGKSLISPVRFQVSRTYGNSGSQ